MLQKQSYFLLLRCNSFSSEISSLQKRSNKNLPRSRNSDVRLGQNLLPLLTSPSPLGEWFPGNSEVALNSSVIEALHLCKIPEVLKHFETSLQLRTLAILFICRVPLTFPPPTAQRLASLRMEATVEKDSRSPTLSSSSTACWHGRRVVFDLLRANAMQFLLTCSIPASSGNDQGTLKICSLQFALPWCWQHSNWHANGIALHLLWYQNSHSRQLYIVLHFIYSFWSCRKATQDIQSHLPEPAVILGGLEADEPVHMMREDWRLWSLIYHSHDSWMKLFNESLLRETPSGW